MIAFVIALLVGIFLIFLGYKFLNQKRRIANTPTSKIRSLALGLVEINGIALSSPKEDGGKNNEISNISPLTKKECIYYKCEIEEYRRSGDSGKWVTIYSTEYRPDFIVKDDTGKVLVCPDRARFNANQTFEEQSRFRKDPSKVVMDFLNEKNIKFENFLGLNKTMKYTEKAIFTGDNIYVMGEALSSGKESDVGHEKLFIGKGRSGFFYISNKSEKDILKKFNLIIYPLFILGGMLVIIMTVLIILIANNVIHI